MSENRILVMGVGNPLMRDEGVGPRVVELLMAAYEFPENVEVTDAGTMGLTILDLIRDVDHLIVADAVKDTGHPAGTVLTLTPEDMADNQVLHSLHDVLLVDVLQNAMLLGRCPATVVVGVQIESIEQWVLELSEPVEEAIPVAAAAVVDQLRELGVEPTAKIGTDANAAIIAAMRTFEPMPESALRPPSEDPEAT
jgi:hydrogenase maturation protease